MNSYLQLTVGNSENVRGRALISVKKRESSSVKTWQKLIEIEGPALKENIYEEVSTGRLIGLDVFPSLFIKTRPLAPIKEQEHLENYAIREFRDLICKYIPKEENTCAEAAIEQMITRYTNVYMENIYMRILDEMGNDLFHKNKRAPGSSLYTALFRVARLICLTLRASREQDRVDVLYYGDQIISFQNQLPFIPLTEIREILVHSDDKKWREMIIFLDAFYLSLKKQYPCSLGEAISFCNKKELKSWWEDPPYSLFCSYFQALFQERYERAFQIKREIEAPISKVTKN